MTSPHQDAAGVVAELRAFAPDGDTMPRTRATMLSAANLIEQQAKALSEAEVERDRQNGFVQRLQTALAFWMPGVDLRLDEATRELAADDACLLAGGIGARDIPCWGEGMLERALAAESRAEKAESALAEAVEVMRPFADEADGPTLCGAEMCDGWLPFLHRSYSEASISNGHLRAARAFVQQHQGKK
jgi:hypothetical protein